MPRHRERTTNKGKWTKENLENARKSIVEGKNSMRVASKKYGIPFATLQRRMKMDTEETSGPSMGRKAILSRIQEQTMVSSIEALEALFYSLNCQQIRYLAYEFAERENIMHNFNKEKKCAGRDWLDGFLKRNPSVTIRKPEAAGGTSTVKMAAFNYQDVLSFFDKLEKMMGTHDLKPCGIYAVDETVITTILESGTLGISVANNVDKTKINKERSAGNEDRGKNVTIVVGINAAGNNIPPMVIYPRQRMSQQLLHNGPSNAIYQCVKDGSLNSSLFIMWLTHFKEHAKPSKEKPCLLILDNHLSHVSFNVIDYCEKNNIILFPIPPHTSHRLQPLNVSLYGPLKKSFKKECDAYMACNSVKSITQYEFAEIFDKAYSSIAADPLKVLSGFRATGIYPINRAIFTTDDFVSTKAALQFSHNNQHQQQQQQHIDDSNFPITSHTSTTGHFVYNMTDNHQSLQVIKHDPLFQSSFPHSSSRDPLVY